MAKRRKKKLNKKVAVIIAAILVVFLLGAVVVFLSSSGDPYKFIGDAETALELQDYNAALGNYFKALGSTKDDELEIAILFGISEVYLVDNSTVALDDPSFHEPDWLKALGCWNNIINIDPKHIEARRKLLDYYYIAGDSGAAGAWKHVESNSVELIEIIKDKQLKPDPYILTANGRAKLEIARRGETTDSQSLLEEAVVVFRDLLILNPKDPDIYSYMAMAATVKGQIDSSSGVIDAAEIAAQKVDDILLKGVHAADDDVRMHVNLVMERLLRVTADKEKRAALRPQFEEMVKRFGASPQAYAAIANFHQRDNNLDGATEAIQKAVELEPESVSYLITAANLYYIKSSIQKDEALLHRAIELAGQALELPDARDIPGPRQHMRKKNRYSLFALLANYYIELALKEDLAGNQQQNQRWAAEAENAVNQIRQILGTTENIYVAKWSGMLALAKGDRTKAVQLMYKAYTQMNAVDQTDALLSYMLAKAFEGTNEIGARNEFFERAVFNKPLSIAVSKPEAVLEYIDVLLELFEWANAVRVLDMYEGYYPPTELSRKLRVRSLIGAGQFDDALAVLNDMAPDSIDTIALEFSLVRARLKQFFRDQSNQKFAINIETDPETDVYQQVEFARYRGQRLELIEELLDRGYDEVELSLLTRLCNLYVIDGNIEGAKALIEKYLTNLPSSTGAKIYRRLLLEPDPTSISDQRSHQINLEVISEIDDELLRSKTLCQYYRSKNLVDDALEELKNAHAALPDDGEVVGLLFDLALQTGDIELAEQMIPKARGMNLDKCNGVFFRARLDYVRKDYQSALQKVDECLELRPVFAYGYLLRSQINVGLGNNGQAIADAKTAVKTNPVDGVTARHRAALLYERNLELGRDATPDQLDDAEKAVLRAVVLNSNDWQLRSLYSEMVSQREPQKALAMRQRLLETNPNMENNLMLGNMAQRMALKSSDELEKGALLEIAGSAYARAYAMEPGSETVLNAYSEFLRVSGQQDKAVQLLGEQEGVLWQFYVRDGQYDRAMGVLGKLYEQDPGSEAVVRGLLVVAASTADNDGLKRYSDELLAISNTTTNELMQIQMYLEAGLIQEANLKLASFRERNPDDAGGMLLEAWAAMTNGSLQEALVLTNQSLEIDPESATAWRLRGQINRLSGNPNDAVEDLQKSKSIDASAQTRMDLARLYHNTGRTAAAIGELAAALEDPGAPVRVRTMLEQLYLESGRTNDLNVFYEECLKKHPDGSFWYFRSGKFAIEQKKYEQAQALLEKACEFSESDADRMSALDYYFEALLLGRNYQKLLEEASKYIDTQFAPVAYSQMAQVQLKLGNRATAVDYFRKAIERSGANDSLISGVLQNMEDVVGIEEVWRWCSQRLSTDPDSLAANLAMYKLAERQGDYNKAFAYANKCMEIVGSQSPTWIKYAFYKANILVLAYQKTSDEKYLTNAISGYEAILSKQPDNGDAMNNLAVLLADNNEQLDKAVKYAKRTHEAALNDANRMDTYAYVLCKTGDFAKAREMIQRAIQVYELSGADISWDVYNHLGMVMEGLGRKDEAATAYRQAMEIAGETVSQTNKQELTKAIERVL